MKRFLSVLLSVMMILSSVSFAVPSIVTVFDSAEEFVNAAYAQDTASLAEDTWTDSEKGIKLFVIDFETKNDGTAVTSSDVSSITTGRVDANPSTGGIAISSVGRINPEYESIARVNIKAGSGASVVSGDNGNYLNVTTAGDSLMFSQLYVGDGTYVFEFETNTASFNNIRGSYNAGVKPTSTAIDGTWSLHTHTAADMTEALSKSCSSYATDNIRFHFSTKPTMYDNITLYYQPEGWGEEDGDGSDSGDGENTDSDIEWTDAELGTLLYTMDFDTKNDGTAVTVADISTITSGRLDNSSTAGSLVSDLGHINPAVDSDEAATYRISLKDTSSASIESIDGNNALVFTSTSYYISMYLGNMYDASGDYTIAFDYTYDDADTGLSHNRLYFHTVSENFSGTLSSGDKVNVRYAHEYTSGDSDFMRIVFYCTSGSYFSGAEKFIVDNISVYCKTKDYVSVTLDANGNSDMSNVTVSDIPVSGTTVADLISRITNNSGKQLLGISKTADGVALGIGETVVPNDGDVLYMIWGNDIVEKDRALTDSEKGYLLFDLDFETDVHYLKNNDKLSKFGFVNTNIVNNTDWHMAASYYEDILPGSGTESYEPVESDIRYELVDGKYNKYLSIKPNGASRWPQLGLNAYSTSGTNYTVFGGANGIYTIEADVRAIIADGSNYSYTSVVVDMSTYDETTATYPTKTQVTSVASTKTVGEWATMAGTLNNTDYDGLTRIKPCNQYTAAPVAGEDEIHFDNLKLYWKPYEVTVNFDNSGNSVLDNQSVKVSTETALTVGDLKALVKKGGIMELKGLSKTEGGVLLSDSTVIDFFGDLNFYTVWEEKDMTGWTDSDYGVLVYDLDFNDAESFTENSLASLYGRVNPNLTDSDGWKVTSAYFSDMVIEDDGTGDKYLKATVSDLGKYPQLLVSAKKTDSYVFTAGGTYTLLADVKVVSSDDFATNTGFNNFGMPVKAAINTDGTWTTTQLGTTSTSDKEKLAEWLTLTGSVDTSDYDGVSTAIYCMNYGELPTASLETLYLDNLRLYWKPSKVVVTVNPGDNTVARTHSFAVSTNGVTVSEIMSKIVDHGDMILKGVSLTKNGEALSGTLNLAADTTLYALWDETGEVLSDYSIEFEYDESSGNDAYWRNHGTNSAGNGYVRHKDGYGSFTFNSKNEHSAVWDANLNVSTFINDTVPAGEIKGIMVRMRYRTVPQFVCSCATDLNSHVHEYKTGKTHTYDNADQMVQMYYLTPDVTAMSETQSLKYKFSVADGDGIEDGWFTFYHDVSANTDFQEKGLSDLRFDFNNDIWDGTIIDIDYIRFIGEKSKAPVTQNTSSMKTSDPMGIRFMASLKKELVSESSAYGWVIAREVSLDNAGIEIDDFTFESASENSVAVLRGYNYGEGREEALNFSEDSAYVYYTAMLYNIPQDMYEDKLVARPFAVVDGVTYYGSPISRSVYDVAKAICDGGFKGCTAAQQTYIQRVIDKVEA